MTLLGFILHDERKFSFNFAFGLALTVLKIAKENGGRAYSTGLYFSREAKNVLGVDRLRSLREFKTQMDPSGLLNPGKVLDGQPLLSAFMGVAGVFEPVVRRFGNAATGAHRRAARRSRPARHPRRVAWYA